MAAFDPSRPLEGLLVVALEQAVAAPFCTSRLADAGARVIKIERAEGDFARGYDTFAGGMASYFVWLNRGKESVVLDFKQADDLALLKRLIARADVFVQNLGPGALDRAGLGVETLRAANPRLIACSISGYGASEPYANRKAYDLLLQAETGMASITGSPQEPGRIGVSGCDIACGMYAHAAILQALIGRSVHGQGATLEVSLFDSLADWMTVPLLQYEGTGKPPGRVGLAHPSIAPYGVFTAGDGAQVLLAIQNPREWTRFCDQVLQAGGLATDPRFADNIARVAHRDVLHVEITRLLARYDGEGLIVALEAADIAFGVLNDVAGLARHPHLRRTIIDTPVGPIAIPCPPALSDHRPPALGAAPALGQHTQTVRAQFAA